MSGATGPEVVPESALLVEVPEAEPLVGDLRRVHDPVASQGVPAHVTVLFPFREPAAISVETRAAITAVARASAPFSYTLARVATFPDVVWLAPDPAGPFAALTRRAAAAFPDCPPYGGAYADVIPHVTVAMTADAGVREEIERAVGPRLPLAARAEVMCLYQSDGGGRWSCVERFPLGSRVTRRLRPRPRP